ncbi:MAG: hypothetical protein RL112_2492 [Planctomycetota bacterium]
MGGGFQTSDAHPDPHLRPVRVAMRSDELWSEVCTMVDDLGWQVQSKDDQALVLVAKRPGGLLAKSAVVTFAIEGPAGLPSSLVRLSCEGGGLFAGLEGVVKEFTVPFTRRVC